MMIKKYADITNSHAISSGAASFRLIAVKQGWSGTEFPLKGVHSKRQAGIVPADNAMWWWQMTIKTQEEQSSLRHFDVCGLHSRGWNKAEFVLASGGSIGNRDIDKNRDERLHLRVKRIEIGALHETFHLSGFLQNGDGWKCGGAVGQDGAKLWSWCERTNTAVYDRALYLELFTVVNRIGDNMIEGVPFNQESHGTANFVRNVVLLGQAGTNFEPAQTCKQYK
jgi:hypothetical protein